MKIVIETEPAFKVTLDDVVIYLQDKKDKPSLADEFAKYIGTKEYAGIVAEIQKWFYGYVSKTAWCATSISYFANILGILDKIGGKNENVYQMMIKCFECSKQGKGKFFHQGIIPSEIKKDDILFFEWDDQEMTTTSNKHVGISYEDSTGDTIRTIGGNQSDSICIKGYPKKSIYAVYRLN